MKPINVLVNLSLNLHSFSILPKIKYTLTMHIMRPAIPSGFWNINTVDINTASPKINNAAYKIILLLLFIKQPLPNRYLIFFRCQILQPQILLISR